MVTNKVNTACAVFALAVGTAVYFFVGNWWYVGTAFVLALLLSMSLRPQIYMLFDTKKPTDIMILRERGFEDGIPAAKVFYALLLTQGIKLDVAVPEHKVILEDIFERAVSSFSGDFEFFRNRYADVQTKSRPTKIGVGICDGTRSSVGKSYRNWIKLTSIDNNIPPRDNIDIFFKDLEFKDTEGQTRNAVVSAQFYRW